MKKLMHQKHYVNTKCSSFNSRIIKYIFFWNQLTNCWENWDFLILHRNSVQQYFLPNSMDRWWIRQWTALLIPPALFLPLLCLLCNSNRLKKLLCPPCTLFAKRCVCVDSKDNSSYYTMSTGSSNQP